MSPAMQVTVEKSDPWLEDGNVVLLCEGSARFRVHASVLARNSEVFRNMFEVSGAYANHVLKTSDGNHSMINGCAVIPLNDATQDCQNLMLALYGPGPPRFHMRNNDDFLHLSSILQMATKYCIDWLRNKAAGYLSLHWPHTLEAYLDLDRKCFAPHPALVINLARKVGLPFLLPLALYLLGRLSPEEAHNVELTSSTGPISPTAYRLSPEDVFNHLRYKHLANVSASSLHRDVINGITPDDTCNDAFRSGNPCVANFKVLEFLVCRTFLNDSLPPFSFIDSPRTILAAGSLCFKCQGRVDSVVEAKRKALWDELPSWFGLPGWNVLTANLTENKGSYYPKQESSD